MKNINTSDSVILPLSGSMVGATVYSTVGGAGIVGGFGGLGLGLGTMMGTGAIAGSALYGGIKAIEDGDHSALGFTGVGAIGGMATYGVVGGMGLSMGGTAVGIGMGTMAMAGGIIGLGVYGIAKMVEGKQIKESFADIYSRMDDKLSYLEAYNQAMMELDPTFSELIFMQKMADLEIESELEELKAKMAKQAKLINQNNLKQNQINQSYQVNSATTKTVQKPTIINQNSWQHHYTFKGHNQKINAFAFNKNGQILASGCDDQTITLRNIYTGEKITQFFGLKSGCYALDLQDNLLVGGSFDQNISCWKIDTKSFAQTFIKPRINHSHQGSITSLLFSPTGKYLFSGSSDQMINVWEVLNRRHITTLKGHESGITCLALSRDCNYLVSGDLDDQIIVWQVKKQYQNYHLKGHLSTITDLVICPDHQTLFSSSLDYSVKKWELKTGELMFSFTPHSSPILSMALHPNGKILATASAQEVKLWDISTLELLTIIQGENPIIFSPDGQFLVTGSQQGIINIWKKFKAL